MPTSVEVAVYCTDPELRDHLRWLGELPDYEPDKHECMAHLHMTLARASWRRAERLRASKRDHDKRSAAAQKRRNDA